MSEEKSRHDQVAERLRGLQGTERARLAQQREDMRAEGLTVEDLAEPEPEVPHVVAEDDAPVIVERTDGPITMPPPAAPHDWEREARRERDAADRELAEANALLEAPPPFEEAPITPELAELAEPEPAYTDPVTVETPEERQERREREALERQGIDDEGEAYTEDDDAEHAEHEAEDEPPSPATADATTVPDHKPAKRKAKKKKGRSR